MLCFVCLKKSEETLAIFGTEITEYNICDVIEKHLNIKPSQSQIETICGECWKKLADFHDFYQCVSLAHNNITLLNENFQNESNDDIKEDSDADEPPKRHIELGKEDFFTQNPFLEINVEDLKQDETVVAKQLKRNFDKGTKKVARRTKTKIKPAKSNQAFDVEAKETEEDKTLISTGAVKTEEEDQPSTKDNKQQEKSECDETLKPAEKKRRKGHALLEENDELIKKHIRMLCEMCTHCSDEFSNLIKHFKEQHPGVKPHIKCCERKLDCPSDILQHAYYHEDPDFYKCSECNKRYINSSALKDHYLQYHEPEENLPYGCDQCPRKFSRKNLLEHHKSKHVPKTERSHFCEICKPARAFANEYILQIHIKNRHKKASNICHVCAKEIRDKQAFEKHVRLHFEESGPRIKCPRDDCDKWLKDKDNLKQHLRRFHDETKYECPQCGRICKNKHSLTCHLKTTHSTNTYTCEECQKNFKSQQSLKEHMAGHAGEPLYNCQFCTRTFNSKANMYSHKKKAHPKEWEIWNMSKRGLN